MSETAEIAHAIAGAGGGALAMIVTYPLVTLSTLAQTAQKKKSQEPSKAPKSSISLTTREQIVSAISKSPTFVAAQEIIKEKGPLGLYAGLESALYGITLTNFIYYYFYELTTNFFLTPRAKKSGKGLTAIQSIIAGAVAGAITCVGSNPFWVANTRMMTEKNSGKTKNSSAFATILDIIEKDGVGTLFAGVLPALVLVINPIIQYTIFEQIKNVIVAKNGAKSFTAGKAFFIGAFGKLIATFLTYPYITLKARMHIKKRAKDGEEKEELSMYEEIKKIIREEGLEGLYAGLSVKLFQSISTAAFLFYFKEELLSGSVQLVNIITMFKVKKQIKQ
ncbi:Peroxisomal membrane protein PMP47 [Scheffersomyces stipitis CBS 6054]|uniref:Mitochondrial thiamine pyrophosphate carrier 1 n=1 Tax=Scheffersomyces stipitis (strain ATCC 58785 / CBS 6054 / NBRC 10063 / NRRL Y-11545) TaxID=322104 RepID=A3GHI2_PICST|nr:Peroxisomal membrane protein PMP47 [Scheffersomyces stipitis CBS 6054]EAZ63057.2 Peroxisomal membrane protein PMP47 [Scheffersomyces stipitis CBS 6054]KAG2735310.1 hypothetical protein G9P44_001524 [Scheffersomyces stipitis]